ncbi:hypothetical protein ABE504_13950 [Paenibacillus oryzisoli]|uniref:hypothetical protein n=1 Tax=Paenibacillus oryzisoli TaxID=1850517 RepID=UPI003D2E02BF
MKKSIQLEVILWSIALPGFGQLLNGKLLKGLLLIGLEFLINVNSNLNVIIISSFHGEIEKTINQTNYQWLMFYPCIYMFGMWDAYKDAGGDTRPYSTIPFVFGAFFGTVGVIFSTYYLGAVWLGIIGCFVGILIGTLIKSALRRF